MNVDVLSADERAYLLGLYLADGTRSRRSKSTELVEFGLQGDEGEIARRVAEMLRRCGLNAHVYSLRKAWMFDVCASGVNLSLFFPDKTDVGVDWCSGPVGSALKWVISQTLEVPFIAGLVDGDGSATAKLQSREGCFFGKMQVQVAFSQTTFPFLVDFVHEYVNRLVAGGASLPDDADKWQSKTGRRVSILARGREALIRSGITKWSFKFTRLLSEVERLRGEVAKLMSRYLTLRELAHTLGVGNTTVWRWCKKGKLKHVYVRSPSAKRRAAHLLVPVDEVKRLKREQSRLHNS
jgi:hypothetical protein